MKHRQLFLQNAEKIKALGFDVYIVEDPHWCFGYVVEGDKFGYFQQDEWAEKICFSTCHKPCKDWGTGFGIQDRYCGLTTITAADVRESFVTPARWNGKRVQVQRYANFDEFTARRSSVHTPLIKL